MRRYACMKKNSTTQRLHTLTVQINEELCLADEQEEPKEPDKPQYWDCMQKHPWDHPHWTGPEQIDTEINTLS